MQSLKRKLRFRSNKILYLEQSNNEFVANENNELRRRAKSILSASVGWGEIQNIKSCNTSNNQSNVDIAISPLNLNTPVDRQMLARTETSAFIASGALCFTPGIPSLISERELHSSQVADNYFTPAQDSGTPFNTVVGPLSRTSISPNSISQDELHSFHQAASAALTQYSFMPNPQTIPLLEELSLDKLKKFELAAITTSDMLLCRFPAYVKSTIVDELALNPIERYSQEHNKD